MRSSGYAGSAYDGTGARRYVRRALLATAFIIACAGGVDRYLGSTASGATAGYVQASRASAATRVVVTPDSSRLLVGEGGSATCNPYNFKNSLLVTTCTWTSRDSTVAAPASKSLSSKTTQTITARKLGWTWVDVRAGTGRDSLLVRVLTQTAMDSTCLRGGTGPPLVMDTVVTVLPHLVTLVGSTARATLQASARDDCGPITTLWTWTSRNASVVANPTATSAAVTTVPQGDGAAYVVAVANAVGATTGKDSALVTVSGFSPNHAGTQVTTSSQVTSAFNGSYGGPAPADTIWFRAGTYGTDAQINVTTTNRVFRAWPGEDARIRGGLYITGAGNTFWGLHIEPVTPQSIMGVNCRAANSRFINNVVTRAGMTGFGFWMECPSSELAGNLSYHNGTHGNLDHGTYLQNGPATTGPKLVRDNMFFDNSGYGVHMYGETGQYVRAVTVQGNFSFENGFGSSGGRRDDIFLGSSETATTITVDTNYTYGPDRSTYGVSLPWEFGPVHGTLVERGNYFAGHVSVPSARWTTLTQSGNTTIGSPPATNKVVVRANPYEVGRGNVLIYNWQALSAVTVDLSTVLTTGAPYRLMNPANMYGTAVVSGTYTAPISVPMSGDTLKAFVVVSP